MLRLSVSLLLVCSWITLAGAAGRSVDYGPKWKEPTDEFVTPHIKWQKPAADGALKALYITFNATRSGMREAVELRQRFDMDVTVFVMEKAGMFYDPSTHWHAYSSSHPTLMEMEEDLLRKLEGDYDVIVLAGVKWDVLPMWARYRLLKKVSDGTALVGMISGADEYLKRVMKVKTPLDIPLALPIKGLPAFKKYADVKALLAGTVDRSLFGKGEIFLLKGYKNGLYQPLTPEPIGDPLDDVKMVEYDYYLAYVGHLLMQAGKKTGEVAVKGVDFVLRNRQDDAPLEFLVESANKKSVNMRMALRSTDNEVVRDVTMKKSLAPGENKVAFDIGKVPAGDYFADLWVKQGERVITYGSLFVQITSPETITKVDVPKVWNKEQAVAGTVTITNGDGKWAGMTLEVKRRDNFGRLTGEWRAGLEKAGNGCEQVVQFSLPAAPALSILQYLEVRLIRDNEAVDKKRIVCSVKNLYADDDLRVVMWGEGGFSYLTPYLFRDWYRMGFDSQFTGFNKGLAMANLWHIPYATRLVDESQQGYGSNKPRAKDDHDRRPALNDPDYRKKLAETLTKRAEAAAPYSTSEFSLGNECNFSGGVELCFAPTSKAYFREFLKTAYGSIEKLNEEYGSAYKSFDEVEPVLMSAVKADRKLLPLWVDFRRAMESQWADISRFAGDTLQALVPGAKVGYDGEYMMTSLTGADYFKTAPLNQLSIIYARPFTQVALYDFSAPGKMMGNGWDGGYNYLRSDELQRGIIWRRIFMGANNLWSFSSMPGCGESPTAPDFSSFDFFNVYIRELAELKGGTAKLVMSTRRKHDGVALLYSASSVHAATMTAGLPQMDPVIHNMCRLIDDAGYQFRVVSYQQVADGILGKGGFKALILPYAQALSKRECEEIRRFVENGGAVIADLRPGVCDEHGKPYGKGPLDEVFGVKQKTDQPDVKLGAVKITAKGFPENFPETATDASLEVAAGKVAVGKVEGTNAVSATCLVGNRYGKGQAMLLNFSLSGYCINLSDLSPDAPVYVAMMRKLLEDAGVSPAATATPERQKLKIFRFESGACQYVGLLEELPEIWQQYVNHEAAPLKKAKVTVALAKGGHIYDVRKGKYMGYADKIKVDVEPSFAQLYAVLPYQVKEMKVEAPDNVKQGGVLEYAAIMTVNDGAKPERHVFHVELVSPTGEKLRYYAKNIVTEDGQFKGTVTLARNEAPGRWTIAVRDVATGIKGEKTFVVQEVE